MSGFPLSRKQNILRLKLSVVFGICVGIIVSGMVLVFMSLGYAVAFGIFTFFISGVDAYIFLGDSASG